MKYFGHHHKLIIRSILIAFVIAIIGMLVSMFGHERNASFSGQLPAVSMQMEQFEETLSDRESITFIMGEDREEDNPYYAQAANYYRNSDEGRTEYLVTTCHSLLEVRDYLVSHPPSNELPWGLVNLVSHGNQWLGLSARVTPDSKRASTEAIETCISDGTFPEVPDSLLDNQSRLYIHGCGIGKNESLVRALQSAFGGQDETPSTEASELFEYYTSTRKNGRVEKSERFLAETWSVNYKMGYRPEDPVISRQLREQYPECDIDWNDALSRQTPRWTGDVYHYTFEVPVKWVIPYPEEDSIPDVSTKELQMEWLRQQDNITGTLEKIELPVEKFNWWFRKVYVNNEDGTRSPALWVKGYCTILVVIRPVLPADQA